MVGVEPKERDLRGDWWKGKTLEERKGRQKEDEVVGVRGKRRKGSIENKEEIQGSKDRREGGTIAIGVVTNRVWERWVEKRE